MEFVRPTRNEIFRTLGGVCLILIALKLPSVREHANGSWGNADVVSGWWCAGMANQMLLMPAMLQKTKNGLGILFLFGLTGLINPFLLFSLIPVRRWQFWCAVVIVVCLAATWLAMLLFQMVPLVGHFIWVAGILLILSREWRNDVGSAGAV